MYQVPELEFVNFNSQMGKTEFNSNSFSSLKNSDNQKLKDRERIISVTRWSVSTEKHLGTSCQIEIHFSIRTSKFVMKYNYFVSKFLLDLYNLLY